MATILYDEWVNQRTLERLSEICRDRQITMNSVATAIGRDRGVPFSPMNMTRLKQKTLRGVNLSYIVDWIERHYDSEFRAKLSPAGRVMVLCQDLRDFYGQESTDDEARSKLSSTLSGIYLRLDRSSPDSFKSIKEHQTSGFWDMDHGVFATSRRLVFINHMGSGCFTVSELSFYRVIGNYKPAEYSTLLEGFAILCGNILQIFLRGAITREPSYYRLALTQNKMLRHANPVEAFRELANPWARDQLQWRNKKLDNQLLIEHKIAFEFELLPIGECTATPFVSGDVLLLRKPTNLLDNLPSVFPDDVECDIAELERVLTNPIFSGEVR